MFHAEFRATTIGGQPADLGSFAAQARADSHWTSVSLSDLAATLGATVSAERDLADVTFPVRRFKPGETLHRAGDKFSAIYVIRSGFFKTVSVDASGAELVLADIPVSTSPTWSRSIRATLPSSRSRGSPTSVASTRASRGFCTPSSAVSLSATTAWSGCSAP